MKMKSQKKQKNKKTAWIAVFLSLILAIAAGCGSSGSGSEQPKDGAPMLTITDSKKSVQAARTTYSWEDGKTGVEADGLHPLDMADDLPVFKVKGDGIVNLTFDIEPDKIMVLMWRESAAGTDAYGDPEFSLPVSEEHTIMLPSNGRYIYQVHASWEIDNGVGGDAYYGFISTPGK